MIKGIVTALVLTGSLAAGPAAMASPADPSGSLPDYGLAHQGHDHGHDHHHGHHKGHDDGAHASGGYDSHRHHPRNW
jgi:hypothetical protein